MIKNIFVDLDGTLLATQSANEAAYRAAFKEVGICFDEAAFQGSFGLRFDEMMRKVAPFATPEQALAVKDTKGRLYAKFFYLVRINQALVDFLLLMKGVCTLTLVTTARTSNAQLILRHFRLENLFNNAIFGEDVEYGKPAPDCYLLALKQSGADPKYSIAIEDSEVGVVAATQAGLTVMKIPEVW